MNRTPRSDGDGRSARRPASRAPEWASAATRPADRDLDAAAEEWDSLATALNDWGVKHVSNARPARAGIPRTPRELFERLARSADPRLQEAAIVLLLTHPCLAGAARAAIASLNGPLRDRAMRRYVAAAALQRMARTRIALALGQQPDIPSAYLDGLRLPSLDADFGRETLLVMAEDEEARYGHAAWRGYVALLDLFLAEIRRRDWGKPCGSASTGRG